MSEKLSDQVSPENEDRIWKCKEFLGQLQSVECLWFNSLLAETGFKGEMSEYLHDYVFNCVDNVDFADYLISMNR